MKNLSPDRRFELRVHAIVFVGVMLGWGTGLLGHWLAVRNDLARDIRN